MTDQHITITFWVDQSPSEVFSAVLDPRAWWSEEIEGGTGRTGDVFDYHFEDVHRSKIRLTEVVTDKRVVWRVLDNYFKPGLFGDAAIGGKQEWIDTRVIFDITSKDGKTRLHFVHEGLSPDCECYDVCSNAWTHYIQVSLYNLITTGKGQPNKTGRPATADEEKLTTK